MQALVLLACCLALLSASNAQAPGDTSQVCLDLRAEGIDIVGYPPNVKPLMDSRNYENLLPNHQSPVWQRVDRDNNNPVGQVTSWTQLTNNPCRQTVQVCGFNEGDQDNWLISQHISRLVDGVPLEQVNVEVEFQLVGCNATCQRTFVVNKYETSTISPSAATDVSNYDTVERLAPTDDSGTVTENRTAVLDFETQETGFYVAIQDERSCIVISRLLVFYHLCPEVVQGLIEHTEVIAPRIGQGSVPIQSVGTCVPNSSPTTGVPVICTAGGVWTTSAECTCDQGFTANEDRTACISVSCPAGFYFSASTDSCRLCPANSESTVEGPITECPCDGGFYRAPGEEDLPCTLPPSPPRNVILVNLTETTALLRWERPLNDGGRGDLVYALSYQEDGTDTIVEFGRVGNSTQGEITGLRRGTSYTFYVSSENAITGQIPDSDILQRAVTIMATTPGASPKQTITTIITVVIVVLVVVLAVIAILLVSGALYLRSRTDKKTIYNYQDQFPIQLPQTGHRIYVDPTTYASPDEAIQEFASEIPMKLLRPQEEIGAGEFGNVYRGTWKENGKQIPVAMKTLKPGSSSRMRNDFLTEASISGQFKHPHVIKLYGVVTLADPVMIVMEFMDNGSLYNYLRRNDERLSIPRLVKMAMGVASGMEYLSVVGYVHRDLAARNILVSKEEVCKVADFGLSRETVNDEYDVKKGGKIPVRWTAPEAIAYRKFTSASDVWSFGVLMWEVMSYAQHPYDDWDNQTVLDRLEAGYRLPNPKDCPIAVYRVMQDCWHREQVDRPSFEQVVKMLDLLLETNMTESLPKPKPRAKKAGTKNAAAVVNPLDCADVHDWLQQIKMERYQNTFDNHGVGSLNQCLQLTEVELKEMGISLAGHLRKFNQSIECGQLHISKQPSFRV